MAVASIIWVLFKTDQANPKMSNSLILLNYILNKLQKTLDEHQIEDISFFGLMKDINKVLSLLC